MESLSGITNQVELDGWKAVKVEEYGEGYLDWACNARSLSYFDHGPLQGPTGEELKNRLLLLLLLSVFFGGGGVWALPY